VILPDVNILLHAFRADSLEHARSRAFLEALVNDPAPYGMSPSVLTAVVRIATHPRIYARPSALTETLAYCRTLLDQPNCVVVVPGHRHWSLFERLCSQAAATGNLVQDAFFAALAIESGCEWVTLDRDYARFEGLRWKTPY
jgi:uncharacterized protein